MGAGKATLMHSARWHMPLWLDMHGTYAVCKMRKHFPLPCELKSALAEAHANPHAQPNCNRQARNQEVEASQGERVAL